MKTITDINDIAKYIRKLGLSFDDFSIHVGGNRPPQSNRITVSGEFTITPNKDLVSLLNIIDLAEKASVSANEFNERLDILYKIANTLFGVSQPPWNDPQTWSVTKYPVTTVEDLKELEAYIALTYKGAS